MRKRTRILFFVGFIFISADVIACTCGNLPKGDTTIKLLALSSKPEITRDKTGRYVSSKYPVRMIDVSEVALKVDYVYTLRGGGDCGIEFEAGEVYIFRVSAKKFQVNPFLIDCDMVRGRRGGGLY